MSVDRWQRPLRSLRLSITDRCNLRCAYCLPHDTPAWLPSASMLGAAELGTLAAAFAACGVRDVRITGGEPLLRRDVVDVVRALAATAGVDDLAMTTNGLRLAELVRPLRDAGLRRVNVSLDTLRADRFVELTRRPGHDLVVLGIAAAAVAFERVHINTVVLRGINDDEVPSLLALARDVGAEARFIECMDVGGAASWSPARLVPRSELLDRIGRAFGPPRPLPGRGASPAERFRLPDGTVFGIVASSTAPFCAACDRARVGADGRLYTCLYAARGVDLARLLRRGATSAELAVRIREAWTGRTDRAAEERLAFGHRSRETEAVAMHVRGG